ncbi:MAG: CDC27 family protein, partial [Bacteroidota bacterium]
LYYKLGSFYNDMEKYDKAENILQKAVVYDPQSEESFIALGYTYFKLNKFNDGILQTNKAILINPKSRLGYHYLANCYMGLNQKQKAMQAYNKLKTFDEDEAAILLEEIDN